MKYKKILVLIFFALASCSKPTIFVLKDNNLNKYYISAAVKDAFESDAINKTPLIAIDGVVLEYDKNADTVTIPLKKNEIKALQLLNKNSSAVIYGPKALDGAVIINTIHLKP